MSGTTTNYGWTYPTSTDYVKDGATAIQTLATGIDTSLNSALGTKPAMGVLLNTTTFTSATTINIDSVFNSTYDYYRIVFSFSASAQGNLLSQLRLAGTPNGSSNYYWARIYGNNAGGTGAGGAYGGTAWIVCYFGQQALNTISLDIINPALASPTAMNGTYFEGAPTSVYTGAIAGAHQVSTAYDGIGFGTSSGNITGKVRVYGYRNS